MQRLRPINGAIIGLRDLRTEGLLVDAEADQTSEKAKTDKKGKENATTDSDTMAVFSNLMMRG